MNSFEQNFNDLLNVKIKLINIELELMVLVAMERLKLISHNNVKKTASALAKRFIKIEALTDNKASQNNPEVIKSIQNIVEPSIYGDYKDLLTHYYFSGLVEEYYEESQAYT